MSDTKFTPAPWKTTYSTDKRRGVMAGSRFIAMLPKPHHYSGQDERYEDELAENKANANLIATAPDMYETLRNTEGQLLVGIGAVQKLRELAKGDKKLEWIESEMWGCKRNISQVLTKARGETY